MTPGTRRHIRWSVEANAGLFRLSMNRLLILDPIRAEIRARLVANANRAVLDMANLAALMRSHANSNSYEHEQATFVQHLHNNKTTQQ